MSSRLMKAGQWEEEGVLLGNVMFCSLKYIIITNRAYLLFMTRHIFLMENNKIT